MLQRFHEPLAVQEFGVPDPQPGAAVARVQYGGICGTDVHLHSGHLDIPTPVVLGHEAVGRIWQLGEGLERDFRGVPLAVGDWVAWSSNIPCGHCYWCLMKQERTLCSSRKIYGVNQRADEWPHLSGGWADFIYLQPGTTIVRLPAGVRPEHAISLGCAGPTVVHGLLHIAGIEFGDQVVVQGSGPVGMAAAMYAHLGGARKVILVGGPANRLALAREMGVGDVHVDVFEITDPGERVRRVRAGTDGGRGADVVVECTGVPSAVAEGIEMCRPSGKCLILGQYTDHGPTPVNPHWITRKQLKIFGSWAFAEAHYTEYILSLPRLLERFPLERLVTPYPLEKANEALADVRAGKVMKAVLSGR